MSVLVIAKHSEMHLHGREEAVGKRSVLQHSIFWEKFRYKLKGLHPFSGKSLLNNKNIKNQLNKELGSIRKTETNHERTSFKEGGDSPSCSSVTLQPLNMQELQIIVQASMSPCMLMWVSYKEYCTAWWSGVQKYAAPAG